MCDKIFPPTGESICSVHSQIVHEQVCVPDYKSSESVQVHSSSQQFIAHNSPFDAISEIKCSKSQNSSPTPGNSSPMFISSHKEQANIQVLQPNTFLDVWNILPIDSSIFRASSKKISQVIILCHKIIRLLIWSFTAVIKPNSGCTVFELVSGLPSFLGAFNINSVNNRDLPNFHSSEQLVQFAMFSRRQQRNRFAGSLDAIHDSPESLISRLALVTWSPRFAALWCSAHFSTSQEPGHLPMFSFNEFIASTQISSRTRSEPQRPMKIPVQSRRTAKTAEGSQKPLKNAETSQ